METLYVVEKIEIVGKALLGELTQSNGLYTYKPLELSKYSTFPWTRTGFVSESLPAFVTQRVMTPYNAWVEKRMESLGLHEYNEWEILKKTKGTSPRDTLQFLTNQELGDVKERLNVGTSDIVGTLTVRKPKVKYRPGVYKRDVMAKVGMPVKPIKVRQVAGLVKRDARTGKLLSVRAVIPEVVKKDAEKYPDLKLRGPSGRIVVGVKTGTGKRAIVTQKQMKKMNLFQGEN